MDYSNTYVDSNSYWFVRNPIFIWDLRCLGAPHHKVIFHPCNDTTRDTCPYNITQVLLSYFIRVMYSTLVVMISKVGRKKYFFYWKFVNLSSNGGGYICFAGVVWSHLSENSNLSHILSHCHMFNLTSDTFCVTLNTQIVISDIKVSKILIQR